MYKVWLGGPQPMSLRQVRFVRKIENKAAYLTNHSLYDNNWSLLTVTPHGFSMKDEVFMVVGELNGTVASRLGPINNQTSLSLKMTPGDIFDVVEETFLSMPMSNNTLSCVDYVPQDVPACELKASNGKSFLIAGIHLREVIKRNMLS
jgi:hypothetical protein